MSNAAHDAELASPPAPVPAPADTAPGATAFAATHAAATPQPEQIAPEPDETQHLSATLRPAAPQPATSQTDPPQPDPPQAAPPQTAPPQPTAPRHAAAAEPDEHLDDVITAYPSARPGAAGAIYGVGITVLVTELARSIAFYRDTLGFHQVDSGDGSAVLASGDTRLVLRTVSGLSAEAGRLIYLNLEVGDVEAVYAELSAKGVPFVHPPRPVNRGDRLELWSATFRDPDDHNIAITQWRAIG
jgi:catechol 2,3-dioxygenase-like lactoylglutathione lyase family enzyme